MGLEVTQIYQRPSYKLKASIKYNIYFVFCLWSYKTRWMIQIFLISMCDASCSSFYWDNDQVYFLWYTMLLFHMIQRWKRFGYLSFALHRASQISLPCEGRDMDLFLNVILVISHYLWASVGEPYQLAYNGLGSLTHI